MNYKYIKPKVQYKKLNIIGTTNSKFMKIQFNILNQKQGRRAIKKSGLIKQKSQTQTKTKLKQKLPSRVKTSIYAQNKHKCNFQEIAFGVFY